MTENSQQGYGDVKWNWIWNWLWCAVRNFGRENFALRQSPEVN